METAPPTLRFLSGAEAGHMVLVEKERVVLGRGGAADVTIAGEGISREHAAITRGGAPGQEVWKLQDLGSRNGTLLNGGEISAPMALKPGDRIRIGKVDLEFDVSAPAAAGTRLEIVDGPGAPRRIALDGTVAAIGRGKAAVDLGDEAEAAEHAQLSLRAGAWRLRPNPGCATYLNGDSLAAEVRLKTGDRIRIGKCALDFVDGRIDDLGGQSVEDCTLATRIGAGTLGVVYRAREASGKEVAVKLLDPGLREDPGAVARFVAGARAQMRLTHPNIVAVRAVAQTSTLPAAVMEWLPGGSLADKLEGGRKLAPDKVLAMAKDLANAFVAADEKRVAHQGLRPSNILFDAEGSAALTDFSLCAPWDPLQPGEGGDPRWIAPEEANGGAADARSNQFSLGLILLQALTGKPPFGVGSRAEVAQARVAGGLPALRAQLPDAPASLERLLARLLARDPQNRFGTWSDARAAIDAAIAGKEREISPPVGESVLGGGRRPSAALPTSATPRPRSEPARPSSSGTVATVESESRRHTERLRAGSSARVQPKPSFGRELGIPSSAWAGIGILALMLAAIIGFNALSGSKPRSDDQASRVEPPKMPTLTERPAEPLLTRPLVSAPAPAALAAQPAPGPAPSAVDPGAPPTLAPSVVMASCIGEKGDQGITAIGFDSQDRVTVAGPGFSGTVDPTTATAAIHGDGPVPAKARFDAPTPATLEQRTVDCGGRQVTFATRQVGPQLQLPAITGPGWSWWSADAGDAISRGLGADARLYDVIPEDGSRFIAVFWSEAANSVMSRDPRDLDQPSTVLPQLPDGPATWAVLGDARTGAVLKAITIPGPPCAHAVDPWGRVYLSGSIRGRDDLGMGGRCGLTVLGPDLGILFDARLGGLGQDERGVESFSAIAYKDGLLALGGTTAAKEFATRNSLQKGSGGGQDALLVVLRLWAGKGAPPAPVQSAPKLSSGNDGSL